jgi:hypothetical protein
MMDKELVMTEDERKLALHHGITVVQVPVYHYRGCRYGNLTDALNYAELVTSRANDKSLREFWRTDPQRGHGTR